MRDQHLRDNEYGVNFTNILVQGGIYFAQPSYWINTLWLGHVYAALFSIAT